MMIKISRFSNNGFISQKQTHHLSKIKYHILQNHLKVRNLYRKNYNDFINGIWCFISGLEDTFELNHLNVIPKINYGIINAQGVYVYDTNLENKIMLEEFRYNAFYLPEKFINRIILL